MLQNFFKSNILFNGYYGHLNTGDDAFIEVSSWGARKYWNIDNNRFLVKNTNMPITQTETAGFPFTIPKTYLLQQKLLLSNSKYFISAGGSTFQSALLPNNIKSLALIRKQKGGNLKVGAIGVSIGPFKNLEDEKAIKQYLKHIDFLAVRDESSFDFVKSIDLPYAPINAFDLAALLPEIYGINKPSIIRKKKIIGISVCPVESISDVKNIQKELIRNNQIVELVKKLDSLDDLHFKFLVINGHPLLGDLDLTKKTIEGAKPKSFEIVHYQKETKVMWDHISSCDFVISSRLHAAIFACFSNTPFMLNEYHKKCTDFLETIGYQEELRLYNTDYDIKDTAHNILNIINYHSDYQYNSNLEDLKLKSSLNFTGVTL